MGLNDSLHKQKKEGNMKIIKTSLLLIILVLNTTLLSNNYIFAAEEQSRGTTYDSDATDENGVVYGHWYWCLEGTAEDCGAIGNFILVKRSTSQR